MYWEHYAWVTFEMASLPILCCEVGKPTNVFMYEYEYEGTYSKVQGVSLYSLLKETFLSYVYICISLYAETAVYNTLCITLCTVGSNVYIYLYTHCHNLRMYVHSPQKALKMVVMKTQSGDEKSALLALTVSHEVVVCTGVRILWCCMLAVHVSAIPLLRWQVLEACVKNCGQRFHAELGKFRFLNEVIRMLSPKVCAVHEHSSKWSFRSGWQLCIIVNMQ